MISYILLSILLLPLVGASLNGVIAINRSRGKGFVSTRLISLIACVFPLMSFILSVRVFMFLLHHHDVAKIELPNLLEWMPLGDFTLNFGLVVDHLSGLMLLIITGVGFLIHLYSTGYMKEDPAYARYMAYLNLFVFFMLTLVMADSLPLLFVGWEGVGLCSYLLIGFWFTDSQKAKAGKKAFLTNRVGDFGVMIGMFLIVKTFLGVLPENSGSALLSFEFLRSHAHLLAPSVTLITLALFFGATGKSAQVPLYVWLPDAMAGPTPVSALIHAATMVTAGIYMIARLHFLFVMAPLTLNVIATVGLFTAVFAALMGLTQYDIKKVLAYSTVSQLGFMFLGLGVGGFSGAFFHVMTHAFFKACLFLGAGSVIHALHHEQDMRRMGGLLKKMPITGITFLICTLAIAGIPPFSGFFSKDEILYLTFAHAPHKIYYWLALFAAGVTAFYMMRLFARVFLGQTRYAHPEHIHESPWVMTLPLIILAVLAATSGFLGVPHHSWLEHWLHFLGQKTPHHIEGSALQEGHLMVISSLWALAILIISATIFLKKEILAKTVKIRFSRIYRLVDNKFYVDEIYNAVLIRPLLWLSDNVLFKVVDRALIDTSFINGTGWFAKVSGEFLSLFQTGYLRHLTLGLIMGLLFIIYTLFFA